MDAAPFALPPMDDRPLWDVWLSCIWLPTVLAADQLSLFDALDREPATAAELAGRLGLGEPALASVLPLLAGLGLLTHRLGRFSLSQAGRLYLRRDGPLYWGHALGVMNDWPVVAVLREAVRNTDDRRHYRAARDWTEGAIDREVADGVVRLMRSQSRPAALGLAAGGQMAGVTRLLDVGGGSGCFSLALARRDPGLRCTVMELPAMCAAVEAAATEAGLGDRVSTAAVDMFREAWPRGHDAILLSNILHDWDPATNAQLAVEAFEALPRGGRVFVHEMLFDDDGAGPLATASFSVLMLLATGGRQYAAREIVGMLDAAGFRDPAVTDAYGYYSLVSARKP